ncbi:MAG: DNA-directed polymerase, partial [Frankiales bacterium]|nr:DNA-directed polymerase [Frankiales bacterium]
LGELDVVLDRVQNRFGASSITRGVLLGADQGLSVPLLPD